MYLTSVLTTSSGVKEQDLVYYSYGETFTNTGTANVAYKYKYTGKELDDSTGLYFYQARYYNMVNFEHRRQIFSGEYGI